MLPRPIALSPAARQLRDILREPPRGGWTRRSFLTTIGIVFPIVTALGFDPVWFGILVTLLMETALITPPVGLNLFVVQGLRTRGGAFRDVCIGSAPFVVAGRRRRGAVCTVGHR